MIIEIDQSGKIEATNRSTVIAFSNNKHCSIIINSQEKRLLECYFRKQGKRKMFIFLTFSALIFLLINYPRAYGTPRGVSHCGARGILFRSDWRLPPSFTLRRTSRRFFVSLHPMGIRFLGIKHYLPKIDKIIIDQEYVGNEDVLKSLILKLIRNYKGKISKNLISFRSIGRGSKAHYYSIKSFRAKKADLVATSKEILTALGLLKQ